VHERRWSLSTWIRTRTVSALRKGLGQDKIKIKILGSECQTSGKYSKRPLGQAGNKKRQLRRLLVFSELPSLLSAAADRAVSILPWVVRRGRLYGFLWALRLFKKI
jgi:hypothetical protein